METLGIINYIAPVVGLLSIFFAAYIAFTINKFEIGDKKITELYNAIRTGSKAYLYRQYKTISIISIIIAIILYVAFDYRREDIFPKIPILIII